MANNLQKMEADVVIAGSGPCGATVARELSRNGKKVVILEKGPWVKKVGNVLVFSKAVENKGQLKTIENDNSIVFTARCIGGGSLVYNGAVGEPDHAMWKKYGIDLTQETQEIRKECRVNKVPDHLIAPAVKHLLAAANELGYPWKPMDKFFDPSKCKAGCMKCIFGCPENSKWTAIEFIREAQEHGAKVLPNVTVRNVIVENGVAGGIMARGNNGQEYEVRARVVVSSAGGMGTARILQRSGIPEAGNSFVGDPTVSVMGFLKEGTGQAGEMSMSIGWHDDEHGVLFANAFPARSIYTAMELMSPHKTKGIRNLFRYRKGMQIMCKITDDFEGRVFLEEGKVSKKYTRRDLQRFDYGKATAEKILIKAGCDPYDFEYSKAVLGHPGGTARVGHLVDSNLQTPIKNLYACDTSVFPEDLGRPPTLSLLALAKRLGKHLNGLESGGKL
ncbi:MAG: GMC family oxidoreductase N-terminal domain-containing protein [Dehalococcoidia bacterium]